jgi:hypothetical protein
MHSVNMHQAFGMGYKPASAVIVSELCSEQYGQALITYVSFCPFVSRLNLLNQIANHLPVSSGTTTRDFLCFFLFWLISLPALWFPIHQMCVAVAIILLPGLIAHRQPSSLHI